MKTTMIGLLLFSCIGVASAQTAGTKPVPPKQTTQQSTSFEDYVNANALTLITIPKGKDLPVVKGEVERQKNLLLSEYKLTILEGEGQFYKIKGEDAYIQVNSMYRLRMMYDTQKNIKSHE